MAVQLYEYFVPTKYPGYYWSVKDEKLYSCKISGILRPLKVRSTKDYPAYLPMYKGRKFSGRYYQVSVEGKRKNIPLFVLKKLNEYVGDTTFFPVERVEKNVVLSSNGRTPDSESGSAGSNPAGTSKKEITYETKFGHWKAIYNDRLVVSYDPYNLVYPYTIMDRKTKKRTDAIEFSEELVEEYIKLFEKRQQEEDKLKPDWWNYW